MKFRRAKPHVSEADSPFLRARLEWNDRFYAQARGKRNWQIVASALLLANLVLAVALVVVWAVVDEVTQGLPVLRRSFAAQDMLAGQLGAVLVGQGAGEMISEITLAIEMGAKLEDLAGTIHPHPTRSESIGMAAELALGCCTDL